MRLKASDIETLPNIDHLTIEQVRPPYELTSDMLLAVAFCPTLHLRRAFPGVPFLSLLGRTPLVVWFARITRGCYRDAKQGRRLCMGDGHTALYSDMTVIALLRRRAMFIPGLYASSRLSADASNLIYDMGKGIADVRTQMRGKHFHARVTHGARHSYVRVRLLTKGKLVGSLLSLVLPLWSWPAHFPSGSKVRARLLSAPRVRLAHVQAGRLSLQDEWLPQGLRFLPLGVYLPGQRMMLPEP